MRNGRRQTRDFATTGKGLRAEHEPRGRERELKIIPLAANGSAQAAPDPELSSARPKALETSVSPIAAMRRLEERALHFLMRGVVHKLNNSLAIFSSHAQLLALRQHAGANARLTPTRAEQDAKGLARAADKAKEVVDLLASFSQEEEAISAQREGESTLPPLLLARSLRPLVEVLLCERAGRRYPVDFQADPLLRSSVPRRVLGLLAVLSIEQVLKEGSDSCLGRIQVHLDRHGLSKRAQLRVRFELPEDYLPFALPRRPLLPDLELMCEAHGIEASPLDGGLGYGFLLP